MVKSTSYLQNSESFSTNSQVCYCIYAQDLMTELMCTTEHGTNSLISVRSKPSL